MDLFIEYFNGGAGSFTFWPKMPTRDRRNDSICKSMQGALLRLRRDALARGPWKLSTAGMVKWAMLTCQGALVGVPC